MARPPATGNGNGSTNPGSYFVPLQGTTTTQGVCFVGLVGSASQPGYIRVNEIEVY